MISITKYEPVIEDGRIVYYALTKTKRYRMPDAYKEMYDDEHLAITETTLDRPELFDTEPTHYIPLRTSL